MRYERDIKQWTKEYAIRIVKTSINLKKLGVDYALREQFIKSGTSIGANVKEAKASSSKRELIRFYEIALRSANETDYWNEVIEKGYEIEAKVFEAVTDDLVEITKVLTSIIIKLKG